MKEKYWENAPTLEKEKQEEPQECNFIPELNRIDFFSRLRFNSTSHKSDLFTQTDFGGNQSNHVGISL